MPAVETFATMQNSILWLVPRAGHQSRSSGDSSGEVPEGNFFQGYLLLGLG